ncbi:pentapeptide repeat-containing protein [Microbacterium sp. NRRL B-14842]|uniref:pentapeptide repeat-containing protein n=1 Tax=Microbacterium sp. NRRL B-14842 TaxID=3162881 RepID=UPI00351316C1
MTDLSPAGCKRSRAPRWRATALLFLLTSVVAGIICAVMWLPAVIVGADLPSTTATGATPLPEAERLAAISSVRQHLLWAAGGLIAIVTLIFTWRRDRIARVGADLERDANSTSRYTEAITQLGSVERSIRLGGIYALERIAFDSMRDHQTILDVLAAYIRGNSPRQEGEPTPLSEDVNAAVSVIGRLTRLRRGERSIDLARTQLHETDLRGAILVAADLSGADLRGATLVGANLYGADLQRASLINANLRLADLSASRLEGADLSSADLSNASLRGARMPMVVARQVSLSNDDLRKTDLSRSNLKGANLTGAGLSETDLSTFDTSDVDLDVAKY